MGTILLDLVWKGGAWWRVRSPVTIESAGDRCKGVGETWKVEQGGEEEIREIDEILDVLNLVSSETPESRIWLWVLGKVRSRVVSPGVCPGLPGFLRSANSGACPWIEQHVRDS